MIEVTTARLALVGPGRTDLTVFNDETTTVEEALAVAKPGQSIRVVTISYDNSPESLRATVGGERG